VCQLPTGTLTLFFTDIEGSTLLLQQLGNQYAEIVAPMPPIYRLDYIQAVPVARESLSEEEFQIAWTEGSQTSLEQVLLTP
jgi:hypothetical protein